MEKDPNYGLATRGLFGRCDQAGPGPFCCWRYVSTEGWIGQQCGSAILDFALVKRSYPEVAKFSKSRDSIYRLKRELHAT